MREKNRISTSVDVLNKNLEKTARVAEWARLMGYDCPKKFARNFLRHYTIRPQTYLKYVRLKNISRDLRNSEKSNFEVARKYGIPDEIALNKFINYHLNCSPTDLKCMPQNQLEEKVEKFGSKIR
jgi:transcriptional regulator GlxA family with amidase domain